MKLAAKLALVLLLAACNSSPLPHGPSVTATPSARPAWLPSAPTEVMSAEIGVRYPIAMYMPCAWRALINGERFMADYVPLADFHPLMWDYGTLELLDQAHVLYVSDQGPRVILTRLLPSATPLACSD